MISHTYRAVLILLFLTSSAIAGPITYTGSTSGAFIDPLGGGQYSGAGTSNFQFGGPNGSTLSYSKTQPSFTTTSGQPFELGSVSVTPGNPVDSPVEVTLAITLSFKTPTGLGKETFDFVVGLETTTRDSLGQFTIAFDVGGTSSVTSNGITYTLELLGLTNQSSWGINSYNGLTACSSYGSGYYLYGELTQAPAPPPAPEPSTFLLGAIGLGAAGAWKWRRRAIPAS